MKWEKKGLIFQPGLEHPFCKTRVMVPTPFLINDSVIRLYCGFCDELGVSRIGFIDVAADNPSKILKVSDKPVLDCGLDGTFDDNGVCPSSIVRVGNKIYLYYFGFQQGVKVPFYMFAGLAISEDNGESFIRYSNVPILERSNEEYFVRSGSYVRLDEDSRIFEMWYVAAPSFSSAIDVQEYGYQLNYLQSPDGINWDGKGETFLSDKHLNFGRPVYCEVKGRRYLFYSVRRRGKGAYKLAFTELMMDDYKELLFSKKGEDESLNWDSEMQCCGFCFQCCNEVYFFYNGNGIGKSGLGYAKLID